jgi:transcription antitermination factor NusG
MTDNQGNTADSLLAFFVFLQNTKRINDATMASKALRSLQKHLAGKGPDFSDISEPVIKSWVDGLLSHLSITTILRYVESLSQLNKHAIKSGYIADNKIFDNIRDYIVGLCDEGFDRQSQHLIDAVRQLAAVQRTTPPAMGYAIDVYLFSFYHAGLDIDRVIELQDDCSLCQMPQTDSIKAKYASPHRKYIFPLNQWQKTTRQNKLTVDKNFSNYLRINNIKVCGKTNAEFIAAAWVAAAKACGISTADICACCQQVMENPKLNDVKPSVLTSAQVNDIKQRVANVIIDMVPHWYAIRFVGKDDYVRRALKEICNNSPYTLYYPIEEIYKKINRKRVVESKPTIRNVMFVQTTAATINKIALAKLEQRTFHVLRNHACRRREYAIIPNKEMRTFSMLVSNGVDIVGEDELNNVEIIEGSYVEITDGFNKGFRGKVLKVRNRDNSDATLLQIEASQCPNLSEVLNKMYITVSPAFVKCLKELPDNENRNS